MKSILCGHGTGSLYFFHSYLVKEFIFVLTGFCEPAMLCCVYSSLFGPLFQEAAVQSTASIQSTVWVTSDQRKTSCPPSPTISQTVMSTVPPHPSQCVLWLSFIFTIKFKVSLSVPFMSLLSWCGYNLTVLCCHHCIVIWSFLLFLFSIFTLVSVCFFLQSPQSPNIYI